VRVFALTVGLGVLLAAGAGSAADERRSESAARLATPTSALARAITPARLRAHLAALQAIARRNGGTRAVGTAGYAQSVAYVVRKLRAAGYRPRLQTFSFDFFRETKPPVLERLKPATRRYTKGTDFLVMRYSGGGNVTARIVPVHNTSASSGCSASDFAGFPGGAIALMKRGECPFTQKARNAEAAGAAVALIANDGTPGRTAPLMATLFATVRIPVLILSSAAAADLDPSSTVHVELSVSTRTARAANVIADLPGRQGGVVLLGGHLDSVASGPGINDNGSGSALVLEVARQARRLHVRPRHGLRFAFWGGEELGLLGSRSYVQSLSGRQRSRILDVLNFDMVGSPNFGRIVYTGDGAPRGSVRIENAFRAYFASRGLPVEEESLGGASDHASFATAGIPVGGLFTGADEPKSADMARRFGGKAGTSLDACYHKACDTVANVDFGILGQMADAGAVVAVRLAG